MEIRKIENLKIYDEFVENSPYNHYMKNRGWGDFKRTSTIKPIYLGFFKDNNLIGTALVLHFEQIIPYMYIPTGMCIDYLDTSLLTEALELLKSFAIDNKCVFLRIDPLVIRVSRDIIGNQIETRPDVRMGQSSRWPQSNADTRPSSACLADFHIETTAQISPIAPTEVMGLGLVLSVRMRTAYANASQRTTRPGRRCPAPIDLPSGRHWRVVVDGTSNYDGVLCVPCTVSICWVGVSRSVSARQDTHR